MTSSATPNRYADQNDSFNRSAKRNGTKNNNVKGTAIKILLAKTKVLVASFERNLENASVISVDNGNETKKPPKIGFILEIQSTTEIKLAVKITFIPISNIEILNF